MVGKYHAFSMRRFTENIASNTILQKIGLQMKKYLEDGVSWNWYELKIPTYNENNKIAGVPEHFNLPWHLVENGDFEKENIDLQWTVPEGPVKCAKCFVMAKLILQ
jgi:hypothetical protein